MRIELFRIEDEDRNLIKSVETNSDGRTDEPLIPKGDFGRGTYGLVFHVGEYFGGGESAFLGLVTVRFGISDPESHYHVPLLVSAWSYSTYRGSGRLGGGESRH